MYAPQSFSTSVGLMILSMLCWGSWANAFSLCRGRYRFELFYWDYAVGVLLSTLAFYGTLGPGLTDLTHVPPGPNALWGLAAGCVFNLGNVLLVAAISLAGMAIAFPLCIGLALLLGVGLSWWIAPQITVLPLLLGATLLLCSIGLDASAYRAMSRDRLSSRWGIAVATAGGVLMGLFPPCLQKALVGPGALDPYAASVTLAAGVALCTLATNGLFMRHPIAGGEIVTLRQYWRARPAYHLWGVLGGAVWGAGLVFNSIAAGKVSVAVSYAFGTGGTLVAVLWGALVWREFRGAPIRTLYYLFGMFVSFLAGILVIAWAKAMSPLR